jgi:hypothetical protein
MYPLAAGRRADGDLEHGNAVMLGFTGIYLVLATA